MNNLEDPLSSLNLTDPGELKILKEDFEAFAYTVSHDLREPVRMVRSFMELLEKKYASELDEKARNYIHYAKDGAQRLDKMILDLLVYYRAVRKEEKEEFELKATITEVVKQLQKNQETFFIRFKELTVNSITADKGAWSKLFHYLFSDALAIVGVESTIIVDISNSVGDNFLETTVRFLNAEADHFSLEQSFRLFSKTGASSGKEVYRIGWAVARRIIQGWGGSIDAKMMGRDLVIIFRVPFPKN